MYEGMEALWRADGKEGLAESEVRQMNALVLAYVGDTVYGGAIPKALPCLKMPM